jgi:VWFA-related protein
MKAPRNSNLEPSRRQTLTWLGVALGLPLAAGAQDDQATFKVDVSVVNVLATVHDAKGRIVQNLNKEDFVLEEEGIRQEIRYFSRQTGLPLTIGLLIDTSMSQYRLIETERRASTEFLRQVLRPEIDMAFVIQFDVEVELLQELSNSRSLLEKALQQLETPRPGYRRNLTPSALSGEIPGSLFQLPGDGGIPWPGGRQRRPGGGPPRPSGRMAGAGTVLYDSVYLAADEVLQKKAGRKAILLISDGVEVGSKVDREKAVAAVQRADTVVYSVRYFDEDLYSKGRWAGRFGSRGKEVLEGISSETGGRMFEVTKKRTLDQIFSRIQEELRNQYSIGYSAPPGPEGKFRRIKLATRDSGLKVQTRQGYYAKPKGLN